MSRLFAQLYLDEDVDVLVGKLLRARGFSVLTTQEAEQLGATDAQQLALAVEQERTLLTHNRVDFEQLAQRYAAEGRTHHGIILTVRRLPHEITRRCLKLLDAYTADEMQNRVFYI